MAVERFPIEAGHILMFARAIGDPNPVYADADSDEAKAVGGIIAPPTFVQASAQFDPDYFLRPKIGQPWFGSGKDATGTPPKAPDATADAAPKKGGGLHAEQHYEYHQPLRAGDVLTATTRPGNSWEKESKRAGKLVFSESITEYRNQAGELVVTARGVGVQTEKPVEN
jgi:acyl dehydratase